MYRNVNVLFFLKWGAGGLQKIIESLCCRHKQPFTTTFHSDSNWKFSINLSWRFSECWRNLPEKIHTNTAKARKLHLERSQVKFKPMTRLCDPQTNTKQIKSSILFSASWTNVQDWVLFVFFIWNVSYLEIKRPDEVKGQRILNIWK